MNREEILEKSRNENKQEDEREKLLRKGSFIPAIITLCVVTVILGLAEIIFLDTMILGNSFYFLITIMCAVQNWYLLAVLKKKYLVVTSILWTFTTIVSILCLINTFQEMI